MLKSTQKKIRSAKKRSEARNEADALVFRSEKALADYKDKIPAPVATEIQSHIDVVKKALQGTDINLIKSATTELNIQVQKIGESLQQAGSEAATGPTGPAEPKAKPDVEEAEVEILDDEDKK